MKNLLFGVLGIFVLSSAYGQNTSNPHTIHIHGMVKEDHTMTAVPKADVVVLRNQDTITATQADASGKYRLNLDAYEGEHLEVHSCAKHHDTSQNLIIVSAPIIEDYHLDIGLLYQTVDHPLPRILFDQNEVTNLPFDITMYKEFMEDNPKVCLQITHYRHPDEPEKLTKKRLLKFEKFLVENGFKMSQIDLNFTPHVHTCPSWIGHCHGELMFEITSMEGHCLQE